MRGTIFLEIQSEEFLLGEWPVVVMGDCTCFPEDHILYNVMLSQNQGCQTR